MKKILALLLVLTMVFSLAACGTKDPVDSGKTPSTENSQPTEETVDTAAKQAFYDTYFTSDKFQPAGNSFKGYTDAFTMSQMQDANGYGLLEIAVQDVFVRIYRTENGVYLHSHGPSEENPDAAEDIWMKYTEAEGENVLNDMELGANDAIEIGEVKKITYVETKDGLDYVKVEVANEDYVEGMKYTEYTLKFTYEEQEYTVTLQEMTGEGTYMAVWDDEELPEELDLTDYKLDVEKKVLVADEEGVAEIAVEILDTKDMTPAATNVFDMYIDAETSKLVKMGAEEEGVYTTLEFMNVEKYEPDVTFPEEAVECTSEEMGLLIFAVLMMTMQP